MATFSLRKTRSLRRNQRWIWSLNISSDHVAGSGEGYANEGEAEHMGEMVVAGAHARTVVNRRFPTGRIPDAVEMALLSHEAATTRLFRAIGDAGSTRSVKP